VLPVQNDAVVVVLCAGIAIFTAGVVETGAGQRSWRQPVASEAGIAELTTWQRRFS
jgi:hypothetical protein